MSHSTDGIAIIGMAGRFPEAPDLDTFWAHLCAGRECVHFFSDAELAALGWDAAQLRASGHVAATPQLANRDRFDAELFGISAEQARIIDPQHRVFLETCWAAVEDAGRNPRALGDRVGVFGGQGSANYLVFNLAVAGELHPSKYFSTMVANAPDSLCSRVAHVCGFTGPAVAVQTACSTGAVAVHQACQSLLNFESDLALAGAVALQLLQLPGYFPDGKNIYSADGHSRIFDAHATGTVFGEGCAVVVLKRLDDALADGDPIRAVIRGSAINNSGTVPAGFTTPSARAQEHVAADAFAAAGVTADSISYVELHGSGTPIGDVIEVTGLARAYRSNAPQARCGIGAVKSNMGHLGAAAGMVSLCKAVLALEHGEMPPTILVEEPNPGLGLNDSPFHLVRATERFAEDRPRRVAVNSYGIGGTNVHLILDAAPARPAAPPATAPHVLLLSARTSSALAAMSARLSTFLASHRDVSLADVAHTLALGRTELPWRRACVVADIDDAIQQLRLPGNSRRRDDTEVPAPTATISVEALATAWISGAPVDWADVLGGRGRRIALPTYPFEGQRHWVDLPSPAAQSSASSPAPTTAVRPLAQDGPRRVPYAAPATPLQHTLCALFANITGTASVGLDDNFFELGGSSVQMTHVHATLRATVLDALTIVDAFAHPTVRELSAQIERVRQHPSLAGTSIHVTGPTPTGRLTDDELAVLRADATLPDDIVPSATRAATRMQHVLLTGATGFLGVYLLHALLARSTAQIYCHVRAADGAAGVERIRKALRARDLWRADVETRVIPVCGDLGDPRLGVDDATYAMLTERIDAIVHNGALVNFTPPYAQLKAVNVTGTEDVLRFACTGPTKAVHFVSSTGVWAGRFPVREDDPLDDIAGLENGYTQSKWVAERLVHAAAARGVPVTIHRPPRVVGDTRTGSANLEDFVARAIKGCAELGAAPAGHFFDCMSPVDYVADAIVTIAQSPEAFARQRFHLVHPALVTWRTVLDFMPTIGIPLDIVPYPEWRVRLIQCCQEHDNALKTLLPLFRPVEAGGFAEIPVDADLSALPPVPCGNATAILAPAGITCPAIDARLLHVYFDYFFSSGFIQKPGGIEP